MDMEDYLAGEHLWTITLVLSTAVVVTSALALWSRVATASANKRLHINGHAKGEEDVEAENQISVIYGTQTGTAERFAKQLCEEMNAKYGPKVVKAKAIDAEFYDHSVKLPTEKLVLLCVATYGDGEPTDTMSSFCDWLESKAKDADTDGSAPLKTLNYGLFALGNRQYEHFCANGRYVDKKLKALGAKSFVERGEGDDDQNIEDDFASWKENLWAGFEKLGFSGTGAAQVDRSVSMKEQFIVQNLPTVNSDVLKMKHLNPEVVTASNPCTSIVVAKKELHTSQSDRSCIHAELDISDCNVKYETGDHVGIYASNPGELVDQALKRLGYDGNMVVKLSCRKDSQLQTPPNAGNPISIRRLFSDFVDLQSIPRKDSLAAMALYASNPIERNKLERLSDSSGKEEYKTYIQTSMRSLLEVMMDMPSVKPPLGAFLAKIAPRLQPRFYSISSSSSAHPNRIHITCAVVEGDSPTGRKHLGIASTWLTRAIPGKSKISIFVRTSNFKLPKRINAPIIMIGPGTGLAPFRGFLQELEIKKSLGESFGTAHLFFGCRSRNQDYIYQDEITRWKEDGLLDTLEVAFSRDQAHKVYVQDKIASKSEFVWNEIFGKKEGYFYVCGDAKAMARDVNKALHSLIQVHGDCNSSKAEQMIKSLQQEGRYLRDVW